VHSVEKHAAETARNVHKLPDPEPKLHVKWIQLLKRRFHWLWFLRAS